MTSKKIKIVVYCLNKSRYNNGIIITSIAIKDANGILKHMGVLRPKSSYSYFEKFKVSNLNLEFDYYRNRNKMNSSIKNDFILIYPVEDIANRVDKHEEFICMIKKLESTKVIIVTVNNHVYNFDWLKSFVDEVIRHDSKNDKLELTESVKRIMKEKKYNRKY